MGLEQRPPPSEPQAVEGVLAGMLLSKPRRLGGALGFNQCGHLPPREQHVVDVVLAKVHARAGFCGDGRDDAGLDEVDLVLLDDLGGVAKVPPGETQDLVDERFAGLRFTEQLSLLRRSIIPETHSMAAS